MPEFNIGDMVVRKSYGADISFVVADVVNEQYRGEQYVLKGLVYRLEADAEGDDLIKLNPRDVNMRMKREQAAVTMQNQFRSIIENRFSGTRWRRRPGTILHIDGSRQFLNSSMMLYRSRGIRAFGVHLGEPEQPQAVRGLLQQYRPDIVVITGHDGLRKDSTDYNSFESYKKSIYYARAVREARNYEPSYDGLCIFGGACQSYYDAIMSSGANFASSPARVLIHSNDPVIVSQRVALTDSGSIVTPAAAVRGTYSGSRGIGGIDTRGRLT